MTDMECRSTSIGMKMDIDGFLSLNVQEKERWLADVSFCVPSRPLMTDGTMGAWFIAVYHNNYGDYSCFVNKIHTFHVEHYYVHAPCGLSFDVTQSRGDAKRCESIYLSTKDIQSSLLNAHPSITAIVPNASRNKPVLDVFVGHKGVSWLGTGPITNQWDEEVDIMVHEGISYQWVNSCCAASDVLSLKKGCSLTNSRNGCSTLFGVAVDVTDNGLYAICCGHACCSDGQPFPNMAHPSTQDQRANTLRKIGVDYGNVRCVMNKDVDVAVYPLNKSFSKNTLLMDWVETPKYYAQSDPTYWTYCHSRGYSEHIGAFTPSTQKFLKVGPHLGYAIINTREQIQERFIPMENILVGQQVMCSFGDSGSSVWTLPTKSGEAVTCFGMIVGGLGVAPCICPYAKLEQFFSDRGLEFKSSITLNLKSRVIRHEGQL